MIKMTEENNINYSYHFSGCDGSRTNANIGETGRRILAFIEN